MNWPTEDIGRSAWSSPRRVHDDKHFTPITLPPEEAAHAASEIQGDDRPGVDELKRRVRVRIFSVATALGVLALAAWVASGGWQ